jgi:hypothetical protein
MVSSAHAEAPCARGRLGRLDLERELGLVAVRALVSARARGGRWRGRRQGLGRDLGGLRGRGGHIGFERKVDDRRRRHRVPGLALGDAPRLALGEQATAGVVVGRKALEDLEAV